MEKIPWRKLLPILLLALLASVSVLAASYPDLVWLKALEAFLRLLSESPELFAAG